MFAVQPGRNDHPAVLLVSCCIASAVAGFYGALQYMRQSRRKLVSITLGEFYEALALTLTQGRPKAIESGLGALIGNTPLIRIQSLSEQTGCTILAKVESVNPGGTVKDRVALSIVCTAEQTGQLRPGGTIYEGTAGSTGISLALVARARGYKCHICIPDDQAKEKYALLEALGATVEKVRPVSFSNPEQFCNVARERARQDPRGFFADQFDNPANYAAHYHGTGPEIWQQTRGCIDAVVMAAGTGGTLAGVSSFLKHKNPLIQVFLIDPPGSALYNKVQHGVLYAKEDSEGKRKKHQVDTITEGIGINNRLTGNFQKAQVDHAFKGSDREAVEMAQYLMRNDGLFVGSSSAMNCVGAVKVARQLGPGHTIVTIICDSGQRHLSKFWNPEVLEAWGLTPTAEGVALDFVL